MATRPKLIGKGDRSVFTQLKQILRISEAAAMKWSNFNQCERTYDLCEHAVWPRKDGKEAYVALGTKSIKPGEVYTLPLFQEVIQVISTLSRYPGCDLIFHDEGTLLTYRQIQYRRSSQAHKKQIGPEVLASVCRSPSEHYR